MEALETKLAEVEHQAKLKAEADKASYIAIYQTKDQQLRLQVENLELELKEAEDREEELLETIRNLEVNSFL